MKNKKDQVIKTQEDLDRLMVFEADKWCIVMNSQHVVFGDSPIYTRFEADKNYRHLIKNLQMIIKHPNDLDEQIEAQAGLISVYKQPFRVH